MTYRNENEALQERLEAIKSELHTLQGQALDPKAFEVQSAKLEHEIAQLQARQAGVAFVAPLLAQLKVATPCNRSWHEMTGDDKVRFCGDCKKSVHNVSAMTSEEIAALVRQTESVACVRLFKRDDGTVLTQDCDVGVERLRMRRKRLIQVGAGLITGAAVLRAVSAYEDYTTPKCHTRSDVLGEAPMAIEPSAPSHSPPAASTTPAANGGTTNHGQR